jgi:hypothetical protein
LWLKCQNEKTRNQKNQKNKWVPHGTSLTSENKFDKSPHNKPRGTIFCANFSLLRGNSMSFEDVENLKTAFTLYDIPTRPPSASACKTFLILQKNNITYTRVIVAPPVYGIKHHFKMLIFSLFSKLKIKHA